MDRPVIKREEEIKSFSYQERTTGNQGLRWRKEEPVV